jgi:hypothetical protein
LRDGEADVKGGGTDVKDAAASWADATAGAAIEYCTGMENEALEPDTSGAEYDGSAPVTEMPSTAAPNVVHVIISSTILVPVSICNRIHLSSIIEIGVT